MLWIASTLEGSGLRLSPKWHFSLRKVIPLSTVPPKNNACARSGARTRNPPQEIKMICFCGLPARTFKTQEVGSLAARRRKMMKI